MWTQKIVKFVSKMQKKSTPRKYRSYDTEFKKNAVKLLESGRSVSSVAESLGINEKNLYEWRKKYGDSSAHSLPLQEKVRSLEKELKIVKQERDILKKALSIFSRQI